MDHPPASFVRPTGSDQYLLAIRVKPNAPRTRVIGVNPARASLEIALHAPPREGEANEELLRFLRETLGVPRANLSLVAGSRSRDKVVRALAPADHLDRLAAGPGG